MNAASPQAEEWWDSDKSDDNYDDARGNRNLSSVIELIRDEGPVEAENKKKYSLVAPGFID